MINTNLKETRFCLSEKEGGSEQLTENVAFVWHSDFRLWEVEKVFYDSFILWRWPPKAQKEFLIKSLQRSYISVAFLVPNSCPWKTKQYSPCDTTWLQPKSNISIDQKTEQKGKYLWGADRQVKSMSYLYWIKGIRKRSIEDPGSQLEIRLSYPPCYLFGGLGGTE